MNRSSLISVQVMIGALLLGLGGLGRELAQGTAERFFPETGYTVREPFLGFFEALGGLSLFGYPITPMIAEPPYQVQCFQNACLRWDPLAPPNQMVQPLPIAEAMGLGSPPIPPQPNLLSRPFRRYILETGHTIRGMFLAFWLRHGGSRIIGNPITEPFVENGRVVQVFQRMKLMWDPTAQMVRPISLGESYARMRGMNPRVPARVFPTPSTLQVHVVLHRSVLATGDLQTITVFVTDEESQPISRARVRIRVPGHSPLLLETNDAGIAEGDFIVGAFPSGSLVEVHVTASDGFRQAEAFASFRIWP
ncbi:MAG: hypothetical protein RMK32_02735 [Anaerolineae bacterium]|nr:hypothetical protein [Thermoflexus sp.]MDW8064532.1 hypothetical protein [Anaerolineae bacterium]